MTRLLQVISEVERAGVDEIIKADELLDIRPARGVILSLAARKYFNMMLKAAGSGVAEPKRHRITKKALRRGFKSNVLVNEVMRELAGTFVEIATVSSRNREAIARVPLITTIEETSNSDDAWIEYEFHPEVRAIIGKSEIYAALEGRAVLALRSRYSLILYEIGCKFFKRRNPVVVIPIDELRAMLNVPEGSLKDFAQFRNTVLEQAKREINQVAGFQMNYLTRNEGRRIVAVELQFWAKSSDAQDAAKVELNRHSVGRKVRREKKVEKVSVTPTLPAPPRSSGIPGVPMEDLDRLMKQAKRPQDIIRRAMESEKREPGSGRFVIQTELKD